MFASFDNRGQFELPYSGESCSIPFHVFPIEVLQKIFDLKSFKVSEME